MSIFLPLMNRILSKKVLAIYGTGGAGIELYEMIISSKLKSKWKEIVFIDDITKSDIIHGHRVFSFDSFSNNFSENQVEVVVAVGEPNLRESLYHKVKTCKYNFATIVSETALISPSAHIDEGSVILDRTIVSSRSHIHSNCFVNGSAIIGHDVILGQNSLVCSFSLIAGHACIGNNSFIGGSSCVRDNISIGKGVIVSMGAVVLNNIKDNLVVLGNPAKAIANSGKVFK